MVNKLKQARKERNKADKGWREAVILRDGYACAICKSNAKGLNCHHILPKEGFPELRHVILNGILLCARHHKFSRYSAHKNSIWFVDWLIDNRLDQYEYLSKRMKEIELIEIGDKHTATTY